jgi:hypothetical protein
MSDLWLDDEGDLVIENGDLVLTTGQEAIKQHILQRLKSYRGEWFLNIEDGVPYFQDILKKNPNPRAVDGALKVAIVETPGVTELTSFDLKYDTLTRGLKLSFSCNTISGSVDFSGIEV